PGWHSGGRQFGRPALAPSRRTLRRGRGARVAPTELGLDERQTRVWEALAARSPALAGMYASVVLALAEPPRVGCKQARVSLICHGMREVMNGLPEAMATTVIPRPSPSSETLKGRLPDLL